MSSVTIQNVTKSFGNTVVLENFDAVFQNGEFITLLGPSGCGKTTMLRIIAGFEKPTSGCVKFDDRVVSSDKVFIPPEKRDIGMVFQSYAVWPHMTVFDNVAYPLRIKKMDKDVIQKKVDRVLAMVHLTQYAQRIPSQLSGGQQRLCALAGILAMKPNLLVLDEPTAGLDPRGRRKLRRILDGLNAAGTTLVEVTHAMEDAARADLVTVLDGGRVALAGTPDKVFSAENAEKLHDMGLGTPHPLAFARALEDAGCDPLGDPLTNEALADAIADATSVPAANGRDE